MELTGELKVKVEQSKNLDETKEIIAQAGMLLSDDEIGQVTGGAGRQQTENEQSGHIRSNSGSDDNYALAAG